MAYVTKEDVELRLGTRAYVQLTDDAGSGSADEAVVAAALAEAEGEVDSYLARRHRVPIDVVAHAEVGPVLAAVTLDVVEYRLNARRPPVPADVAARYRAALAWLAAVGSGEAVLPAAAPLPGSTATGTVAAAAGDATVLGRDELAGL
ncbi:MAG TPA: DUF1320 family protein [Phycisphaerae bacterium]|nr:DUF1320 family protein [Phycisphaerales bacterium]HRX86462.1 DUF1320 family protein [Phycisphaerae bacterium]